MLVGGQIDTELVVLGQTTIYYMVVMVTLSIVVHM